MGRTGQRLRRVRLGAAAGPLLRLGVVRPPTRGLVFGAALAGGLAVGLPARGPRKSRRVPSFTTVVRATTTASPTTIDTIGGYPPRPPGADGTPDGTQAGAA